MEVKIGVQNASRELVIDSDQSSKDVQQAVSQAITGDEQVLVLVDVKGRTVVVPTDKLAYVEIGSPSAGQVGFRS
jgi:mannose/fructose-specific phosphotransferase system component IIA